MNSNTSYPRKTALLIVSFLFLVSNSAFVHSQEINLWTQRKKSIQMARRPNSVIPSLLPHNISDVITNGRTKKWIKTTQASDLKNVLKNIPQQYGTIRDVVSPKQNKNTRVLIHIQDVHMNHEAQANIGEMIQALINKKQVDLVMLEGAFGPINFNPLRDFHHKESVQKVANYLLRENRITGPIHTAMTSPAALPPFIGVDDLVHYNANVEALRDSDKIKDATQNTVQSLKTRLEIQKETKFNPGLRAFDRTVTAYHENQLEMGAYATLLVALSKNTPPHTKNFLDAISLEQSMDLEKVQHERRNLLAALLQKLTPAKTAALTNASVQFQMDEINHIEFYQYLQNLCRKNGIQLTQFPALNKYLRYLVLSDVINPDHLIGELKHLEKEGYEALIITESERKLVNQSRRAVQLNKLVNFSLTPEEWKEYKKPADRSPTDVASFENFYKEAQTRDHAITANLLKAIDEQNAKVSVLVTGGFHASGIKNLIKDQGLAVVSWVPKMTKIESADGSAYLSVFTQEKSPLDRMFEGEKLFLTQQLGQIHRNGDKNGNTHV